MAVILLRGRWVNQLHICIFSIETCVYVWKGMLFIVKHNTARHGNANYGTILWLRYCKCMLRTALLKICTHLAYITEAVKPFSACGYFCIIQVINHEHENRPVIWCLSPFGDQCVCNCPIPYIMSVQSFGNVSSHRPQNKWVKPRGRMARRCNGCVEMHAYLHHQVPWTPLHYIYIYIYVYIY